MESNKDIQPLNSPATLSSYLIKNDGNISSLVMSLADDSFYHEVIDLIDEDGEADYSTFNDLEMIYLFVHQERDLNDEKNRKDNTKKEYLRDLLIFYKQLIEQSPTIELEIEHIYDYQLLKKLTKRHMRKYQEWIKKAPLGKSGKPYSVATLSRKMVIIKGFFSFLFECKYIDVPLHSQMKSSNVRMEDRPLKDLTAKEVAAILNGFKHHPIIYSILSVLATSGIRVAELCTVRVCDLTYLDGEYWMTVRGKGNKKREVLIYPNVLKTIIEFRKRRRLALKLNPSDTTPLFTTAIGKAYDYKYLSNYLTQKIQELDLEFIKMRKNPITPHSLRHAWAIYSSEQGVSLQRISEALGHADIKTTMIYLRRSELRKTHAAHAWKDSELLKNI